MKRIETYRWRTRWAGRWTITRYHASEAEIRVEHPEAERVPGTLIVRQVPETPEELAAAAAAMSHGVNSRPDRDPRLGPGMRLSRPLTLPARRAAPQDLAEG